MHFFPLVCAVSPWQRIFRLHTHTGKTREDAAMLSIDYQGRICYVCKQTFDFDVVETTRDRYFFLTKFFTKGVICFHLLLLAATGRVATSAKRVKDLELLGRANFILYYQAYIVLKYAKHYRKYHCVCSKRKL